MRLLHDLVEFCYLRPQPLHDHGTVEEVILGLLAFFTFLYLVLSPHAML